MDVRIGDVQAVDKSMVAGKEASVCTCLGYCGSDIEAPDGVEVPVQGAMEVGDGGPASA